MKRLIKLILNIFPRTLLQRAAGWAVPLLGIFYLGRGRECPLCGARRRRFLPYGYVTPREDALCPRCLSLERHRLLWLYLERETSLGTDRPRLLHAAPEVALMRRLRRLYSDVPERYVTVDLESPLADMHFDIQQMPLADGSFDVVICNHILEHVEDDRRALREIFRVMRGGGGGIILSPVEERTRLFGQSDHRRVYGRDYASRLAEAGFEVEDRDYAAEFSAAERTLYALPADHIYIVRKPVNKS